MRQKRIIMIAVVFIIIVAGLTLILGRTNSSEISQALSVPSSFNTAVAYNDSSAVIPNGTAFIDYSYATGKGTSLGPNNSAGGLTSLDSLAVSSDSQYLLFHDEVAAPGGFLYSQLVQAGQDPTLDYWWVYNVAKQTFTPLPQGILIAKFSGDSVVGLASANGGEALTTYGAGTFTATGSIPIPGSSDFFPVQGGYLLQTPDNTVLFTKNGTVSQSLYTAMTLISATTDGQTAVGVSTTGTHQLDVLTIGKDSQKAIANNIVNQPVWLSEETSNGGAVLYSENATNSSAKPPTLHTYNLLTHKTVSFEFRGSAASLTSMNLTPVALIGGNTAIVSSSSTNSYLIGNGLAPLKL